MADALVGILVGSESDRERMEGATKTLDELGVAYEFEVRSAHRTPDLVAEYAKTARERGLKGEARSASEYQFARSRNRRGES